MTYPANIAHHAKAALGRCAPADGLGKGVAANLRCGSYVRFLISIDDEGQISQIGLRSNGCGYMLASANVLASHVDGRNLRELHGSEAATMLEIVGNELGTVPDNRAECARGAVDALSAAFADLRSRRIEEFRGEEALICTCFGVSERTIETIISIGAIGTVDEITAACNAGGGCGACRMLIQEMIDDHAG